MTSPACAHDVSKYVIIYNLIMMLGISDLFLHYDLKSFMLPALLNTPQKVKARCVEFLGKMHYLMNYGQSSR